MTDADLLKQRVRRTCLSDIDGNFENIYHDLVKDLSENMPEADAEVTAISDLADALNETEYMGKFALHIVSEKGKSEDMRFILEELDGIEMDPIAKDSLETPLHIAVRLAQETSEKAQSGQEIVELLLEHGCELNSKNVSGKTPEQLLNTKDEKLKALFAEAGRDAQEQAYRNQNLGDVVDEDDDGPTGSASDSD